LKLYNKLLGAGLLATVLCNPGRATLIGNDFSGNLYDVNLTTGAATNERATGIGNLAGIAFNGTGVLYGISMQALSESLYRINPATGASTLIGSSPVLNSFTDEFGEGDLRFDPVRGMLFGIEYVAVPQSTPVPKGFSIDPGTGAIANFLNLPCFNNSCVVDYSAVATSVSGRLYLLDTASIDPFGHLIIANGNPYSLISNVPLSGPLGNLAGMDFDPVSGNLYVADGGTGGGSLYTLNPTTGTLTLVGGLGVSDGLAGLAFSPAVPEPGSFSLLAFGALGGLALRRFARE
jgi:DNA-binding beta-propeller fold protein YncE